MRASLIRLICFLLVFSVVFPGSLPKAYADEPTELIANGKFDNAFNNWDVKRNGNTVEVTAAVYHSAAPSVHLVDINISSLASVAQTIETPLNPYKWYKLSFWTKTVSANGGTPQLTIRVNGASEPYEQIALRTDTTDWLENTVTFGPPGSGSDVEYPAQGIDTLSLTFSTGVKSALSEYYMDDVSLVSMPDPEPTVYNGRFDDGLNMWEASRNGNTIEVTDAVYHSASSSVHLEDLKMDTLASVAQTIGTPLNSYRRYTLTYWTKTVSASGGTPLLTIRVNGASEPYEQIAVRTDTTAWLVNTVTFGPAGSGSDVEYPEEGIDTLLLTFSTGVKMTLSEYYLDDVSLVRTPDPEPTVYNGRFEDGLNEWVASAKGNTTVEISSTEYHSSTAGVPSATSSVHLTDSDTGNLASVAQTIETPLNPYQWYTLMFWTKTVSANGGMPQLTIRINGGADPYEQIPVQTDSTEWLLNEVTFGPQGSGSDVEYPAEGIDTLSLTFGTGVKSALSEYYLDDVSLVGTPDPVPTIHNGQFEDGLNMWEAKRSGNTIEVTEAVYHSAASSVHFVDMDAGSLASITQAIETKLQSEEKYTLRFWTKLVSASGGTPQLTIRVNGADELYEQIAVRNDNLSAWLLNTITFGPEGSGSDVEYPAEGIDRLELTFNTGVKAALSEYYLDDVTFILSPDPTLLGGGFEDGLNLWVTKPNGNTIEISTTEYHSGTSSVHLADFSTSSLASIAQTMTGSLNPHQKYKLSFWAKLVSIGGGPPQVTIRINGESKPYRQIAVRTDSSDWLLNTITFGPSESGSDIVYPPEGIETLDLTFTTNQKLALNEYYLDDVEIAQVPDEDWKSTPGVPAPWQLENIGSFTLDSPNQGRVGYKDDKWTIWSSGTSVSSTADNFTYVYQNINMANYPNGVSVVATVYTLQNIGSNNPIAGIMFRESNDPDSKNVNLRIRVSDGKLPFIYRADDGGDSINISSNPQGGIPVTLKLTRVGDVFVGYYLYKGQWAKIAEIHDVDMGGSMNVGIMHASSNPNIVSATTVGGVHLDAESSVALDPPPINLDPEVEKALGDEMLTAPWDSFDPSIPYPQALTQNRVHMATRLGFPGKGEFIAPEFANAESVFKDWGADAYTRHVKSADEDPWWPSAVPVDEEGQPVLQGDRYIGYDFIPEGSNIVQDMIDRAHADNLHMIAYYYPRTDARLGELHPDWVCKQVNGTNAVEIKRGDELDITGPYREVVAQRLLELAAMGVDGIFFDETHMPEGGCWGTALASDFKAATGYDTPTVASNSNSIYRLFIKFQEERIVETFQYWRDYVHAQYPNVAFIVSTTVVAGLTDPMMSTNLARVADLTKTEYDLALKKNFNVFTSNPDLAVPEDHIRKAFGWTLLRDSADGRPPHVWLSRAKGEEHLLTAVVSLLTYGAIANVDISEKTIADDEEVVDKPTVSMAEDALALGRTVSAWMAGSTPVHWAAVHYSELQRNHRLDDYAKAWREVMWPAVGAFGALTEAGLSVGIVDDYRLTQGDLEGYKLLFLPNPDELTEDEQQAVAAFQTNGGVVIDNDSDWEWSDPEGTGDAADAFMNAVAPYMASAPVRIASGPVRMHAVTYSNEEKDLFVVPVTNDFNWVDVNKNGDTPTPPSPVTNAVIRVNSDWVPDHVLEALSGQTIVPVPVSGGYTVALPAFQEMALLILPRTTESISYIDESSP